MPLGYGSSRNAMEGLSNEEVVKLSKLRENEKNAARLLESLTPGGSEFVDDPEYCAKYVKELINSIPSIILPIKKENEKLREDNERMKNELKKYSDEFINTPEQAAHGAVSSHHDPEVRRMYGHYYRMFLQGQQWQKEQMEAENAELRESRDELLEILKEVSPLLDGLINRTPSGIKRIELCDINILVKTAINNASKP